MHGRRTSPRARTTSSSTATRPAAARSRSTSSGKIAERRELREHARAGRRDHVRHRLRVQGHGGRERTCQPALCSRRHRQRRPATARSTTRTIPAARARPTTPRAIPATPARLLQRHRQRHADGTTDYPTDYGCAAAGGNERGVLHARETDAPSADHDVHDERHHDGQGQRPARHELGHPRRHRHCSYRRLRPRSASRSSSPCRSRRCTSTRTARAFDTVLVVRDVAVRDGFSYCDDDGGAVGTIRSSR